MEASALPASVGLARARLGLGAPLLRLRSDEQLVSLFRAGNEDAFRVIHDRYRARMLAYARQMLAASPADAEDAVQEIFVRAYAGLRANRRDLALRAWLYRVAHNRCIDDLRRPHPVAVEEVESLGETATAPAALDPHARVEQREALRRLIADVQRLPEQQRSALLMRELGGMPYADLAGALGVSVPAVKSLLVRARVGLAQASEARDTACGAIREDLIVAHDRGVRASGRARRHLRDCTECRRFRTEVQGVSHTLGALLPVLGPLGVILKIIGLGGGGGAAAGSGTAAGGGGAAVAGSGAAAAGGGAVAAGGGAVAAGSGSIVAGGGAVAAGSGSIAVGGGAVAAGGGAVAAGGGAVAASTGAAAVGASSGAIASAGVAAGAGHVATILAATAIAAGGAIGIQHEVSASARPAPPARHARVLASVPAGATAPHAAASPAAAPTAGDVGSATDPTQTATTSGTPAAAGRSSATAGVTRLSTSAASASAAPAAPTTATTSSTTTSATTPTTATTATTATTPTTPTTPTIADPTSGTTTTPIAGSAPGGGTATPPTTASPSHGNPGTANGIVPTVSTATTYGATRHHRRRGTWRYGLRGVAAASAR